MVLLELHFLFWRPWGRPGWKNYVKAIVLAVPGVPETAKELVSLGSRDAAQVGLGLEAGHLALALVSPCSLSGPQFLCM